MTNSYNPTSDFVPNNELDLVYKTLKNFAEAYKAWCENICPQSNGKLGYCLSSFHLEINGIELTLEDLGRIQHFETELNAQNPQAPNSAQIGAWIIVQDEKFGIESRTSLQRKIAQQIARHQAILNIDSQAGAERITKEITQDP